MIALTLALLLAAQDADAARIQDLVRRLGAEDFAAREEATRELRKVGKPAEEALRKAAAESPDPEVRERAKALLQPERRAEPAPAPVPGARGRLLRVPGGVGSVSVVNVNGEATYTITPADGSPGIVFRKSKSGGVSLEHADAEGKRQTASSETLEAFLKDHKALAERFGITADGIEWAGNKVGFDGGNAFHFNFGKDLFPKEFPFVPRNLPGMRGVFLPVDEALRSHLDLAEGGALLGPVLPGSAAEQLGLRRHDVLLEIDGAPVRSPEDASARLKPGSRGEVLRKGRREPFGKRDF
jgi:hypothetical protein